MKMFRLPVMVFALLLVGMAPLHASLVVDFNQLGNLVYSGFNQGAITGYLGPDFTNSGITSNVLFYNLSPALNGSFLFNGDVPIYQGTTLVADLRFTDAAGNLTYLTGQQDAYLMIFYSNTLPPASDLKVGSTYVTVQLNADGTFSYLGGQVMYDGVLAPPVPPASPEPASVSLFLLGLGALGFRALRRKI
jgi:hypothetical protein